MTPGCSDPNTIVEQTRQLVEDSIHLLIRIHNGLTETRVHIESARNRLQDSLALLEASKNQSTPH